MTEFTPLTSLAGGMLIGLSAVLFMFFEGRIAGISGIALRLLPPWRGGPYAGAAAFIGGLIAAPLVWRFAGAAPVEQIVSDNALMMIAAGLLTGFGAVWGNGCTSGHGVCGLSRLSPRSFVAVAVFMSVAMLTVFMIRHGGV